MPMKNGERRQRHGNSMPAAGVKSASPQDGVVW